MATKTVDKPESSPIPPEREVPEFETARVKIDDAGQCWRTVLARAPEGLISDDLRNPKIWRKIQGNRNCALVKLDQLFILAHDESWAAEARVTYANSTKVMLAITKVFTFRAQSDALFNDGTLEVFWDGQGFGVRRMSDGVRTVPGSFTSEGLAIDALRKSYPRAA